VKQQNLIIRGAKTHNLKNVSLSIPKNKLVVFTGVSGSGKSSLVFDTIYSEGQRRYVESLSSYARQFLGMMDKPDVDSIEGISPAIAIDQKSVSKNPRSTVGTITEIYDYLRLLFAHTGEPHCPDCDLKIESSSTHEILENIKKIKSEVVLLAPLISGKKGEHKAVLSEVESGGFLRVRLDGTIMTIDEALETELDSQKKHSIDVYIDKLTVDKTLDNIRLLDSLETALKIGKGTIFVLNRQNQSEDYSEKLFSDKFACHNCGFGIAQIEPRTFSFNSPYGACSDCSGIGTKMEVDPKLVVPNKNLTLAEGAIKPWMTASHRVGRQGWYWVMLQRLSVKYDISMDKPIKDIPEIKLGIILTGDDELEGVIPNLERRYKETDSDFTRNEIEKYMNIRDCPSCEGKRLKPEALAVKVGTISIHDVVTKGIDSAQDFFTNFEKNIVLQKNQAEIARPIVREIKNRLEFLQKVGLGYITLARQANTLSGGEAQRIRLATQLGSKLSGVFYILDEPSVGLHARDQKRLVETMKELRDLGNTVLVVEHDPLTIQEADYIVDIGPAAGKHGGKILFQGTPNEFKRSSTLTAQYIAGRKIVDGKLGISNFSAEGGSFFEGQFPISKQIPKSKFQTLNQIPKDENKNLKAKSKNSKQKYLIVKGAAHNNLKNIDVKIPLGKFVCVAGVSGSGKSSLVNDILAKALIKEYHGAQTTPGEHKKIEGLNHLNKTILIDQSPIGRTPRSNPATYTGMFAGIRELFAQTQESKSRGWEAGRFSFNVKKGRCSKCKGGGVNRVEMFFMPDIYVECEKCNGKRYSSEVLDIKYKGKNISEVLHMTIEEAAEFFANTPMIKEKLDILEQVGLGYMELGQPAPSLSGGEAQRVKLATELSRRATGQTLYILDEPTTGLHSDDINKLLSVLKDLVAQGNSVLVIEHNLDTVANADWVIDLGPEGGDAGGEIVAEGTPAQIMKIAKSYTGKYLKQMF